MRRKLKLYRGYVILLFSIILILIILNLIYSNKTMYIDIFGKRIKSVDEILIENESEYYLSFDCIKENIDEEIYFDNISKKVVISVEDSLLKAKLNEKSVSKNFNDEAIDNVGVIQKDGIYISLEVLEKAYNLQINLCNNTIYIYENNNFECTLKTNNISVYAKNNTKSKIVGYVYKTDKIIGFFENEDFVFVKINDSDVGYVLKDMIKYSIKDKEEKQVEEKNKVYVFADNNTGAVSKNISADAIFINMFDITKQSASINVRSINDKFLDTLRQNDIDIYGIVSNGYNLAGFNTSTISQILADESKRITLINNLEEKVKQYNLAGIVIDFRMIKETDVHNYIQFIKEFKALSGKDVLVNIDANEYKNYMNLINYSDLAILNIYGLRDLNSTVSGSISDINWMENVIKDVLNVAHAEKIIVGIPAYTILWTEKNSNVVNSEIYNLTAIEEYISKNSLTKKYNENAKQNYVELRKGSLTYKLWVEDEVSIKNRIQIIQDNNINKVAVYKLGYQNDSIMNMVNELK